MFTTLSAVLPFFAVIGLGAFAARRGMIPSSAVGPLNTFVFRFAMPALIIKALWSLELAQLVDGRFLLGWLITGLLMYGLGIVAGAAVFGAAPGRGAVRGQGSAVSNTGFLGFPLIVAVLGEAAAGPIAMTLLIDLVVIIPLSIAWLEGIRGGASGRGAIVLRALVRSVRNPFFLSIAAGAALSALRLPMPDPVERLLGFLSGAAGPAALFSLGVYLAAHPSAGRWAEAALLTTAKLLIHPLLVAMILGLVLGLDGIPLQAALLVASLPVAANVFVIAQEYETAPKLASDAVLISTVVAVFSVSALTYWLLG
ncbi:MAG: AEC family transporter [Candidatus Competibacterales bacterium]|nr:AEC family transporter [Candidatus Competibacterales bacterium]